MQCETGSQHVDSFLRGLCTKETGDRIRRQALQKADRGMLAIDPFVLKMAVQISLSSTDKNNIGKACATTLLAEHWSDPAVIADVTCALTRLPSPWIFLDQLVCRLQDRERKNGRITFNTAAGILAGTLLSCGRPNGTWISYSRTSMCRTRDADERLAIAIVEAVCTWPAERMNVNVGASVLDEAGKLIDLAVQEYVNPGREDVSTDRRIPN